LSVYDQNYRPIELIVVDDGSTDNTISIVNEFKVQTNSEEFQIHLIKQRNAGASAARNKGIRHSSGDYIQFLDSDDLLLPLKIQSQIKAFKKNVDVIYSRAQFFSEVPNNLMNKYWGRKPQGNSSDYFEFPWQTMCALYRKDTLDKFGYWKEYFSLSDDWEFAIRYKILANVKFLDEITSLYRSHEGDRVGNNLSIKKIKSLSEILISTYELSDDKKLINQYLKKRYRSRLIYCIIIFGSLGAKNERKNLLKEVKSKKLANNFVIFLGLFSNTFTNRILIRLYNLLKR
jgi:glycosyltransferase involved in cell wall biosynthesis